MKRKNIKKNSPELKKPNKRQKFITTKNMTEGKKKQKQTKKTHKLDSIVTKKLTTTTKGY